MPVSVRGREWHCLEPQVKTATMAGKMLECMARAAYQKHPLRNISFKNNVIEAAPIDWEALDEFEKAMLLDAQRAALEAMIDAIRTEP